MQNILNWGIGIFIFLIISSMFTNCRRSKSNYDVTIQQTLVDDAASGLNLQAVGELVQTVKNAEAFERRLNDSSEGINNLDLDEDDQVDYIQVTEYGEGNMRGFSLTVDLAENETQEVATIEIEKTDDSRAHVQTYGNRSIYGSNHYYRSSFGLTDILIMGWLFGGNRPYYTSPWSYGRYPNYYRNYSPMPRRTYDRRMSTRTQSSRFKPASSSSIRSQVKSPNASKTANNIKAPLRNPTRSQKSFQARNPSKKIASGGFGQKKTSSSKPSNPSVRYGSGSSSKSGSSWGGK